MEVFDVSHDLALAKATATHYIDYLKVGKIDGEWKLINVLWVPDPDAPALGG